MSWLEREVGQEESEATQWGREKEPTALAQLAAALDREIVPAGTVVLTGHRWLAARPDGLLGGDGMVEVKCPYRARETSLATLATGPGFCLQQEEDGRLALNIDHDYYYQVPVVIHYIRSESFSIPFYFYLFPHKQKYWPGAGHASHH